MVYKGRIRNGLVVLEEPAALPEGAEVTVSILEPSQDALDLRRVLRKHASALKGLPSDLAENHDHHVYAWPKH